MVMLAVGASALVPLTRMHQSSNSGANTGPQRRLFHAMEPFNVTDLSCACCLTRPAFFLHGACVRLAPDWPRDEGMLRHEGCLLSWTGFAYELVGHLQNLFQSLGLLVSFKWPLHWRGKSVSTKAWLRPTGMPRRWLLDVWKRRGS